MGITCRGILSLPYAKRLRLVAGESGLSNEIQWVHVLEEPRYAEWLKGGELIILSGVVTGDREKDLIALIRRLFEKEVAGVILNLSTFLPVIPQKVLELGDLLGLPLFEMPAEMRIVDVSRSIGFAIFQQQRRMDETEAILLDLLTGKRLSDKRLQRLRSVGLEEDKVFRAAVFLPELPVEIVPGQTTGQGMTFYEEDNGESYLTQLADLLRQEISNRGLPCHTAVYERAVLWLLEVQPGKKVGPGLRELLDRVAVRLPQVPLRVGVGEEITDLRQCRVSASHARDALTLKNTGEDDSLVVFYDDMVSYQLFQRGGTREELGQMAERVLRGLLLPENRELLDTLLCYLKTNCNARAAAEQMYLHVNTLHYRLKKIQAILNRDLGEMDDLFDVMLALKILVFLHSEERDLL